MELSTLFGFIAAIGILSIAVLFEGAAHNIFDPYSILLVFGGSLAVVAMRFNFSQFKLAFRGFVSIFRDRSHNSPHEIMMTILDLAKKSRKEGFLALENTEIKNPFLKQGIQHLIDGLDPETIHTILTKEMLLRVERQMKAQQVFRAFGEVAPAMGMIGTLIGLVQMLAHLNDPASIGPAMALAMLTTLYGAVFAHMMAFPIAEKISVLSAEEVQERSMIIDAVLSIQKKQNPRIMYDLLKSYLPKLKLSEKKD